MTTKYDISKLETHKFWQGKHTKHVVEVLNWAGTVTDGGAVFVRRAVAGPYPYEYRAMNLVDLLQVHDPLPNFPEKGNIFVNEYAKAFRIDEVIVQGERDDAWIIFSPENVMEVAMYNAMPWKKFRTIYKEL